MIISLDMYQTLFAAVCVLMLGRFLKVRIGFLEKFCIPAPVIGGVLFAVFTCLCYVTGIAEFEFDDILKEVCMVFFFTSVGFQANLKVLKSGGKSLILFLGLVVALILCQNFLAVGLADLLGHLADDRSVHRFHPDGRRPRHGGRVRPRAGGLRRCGRDHALHGSGHLRPDRGQRHGRPDGSSAH